MLDPQGHTEKVARNRDWSAQHLHKLGINFISKNNGVHLIVKHDGRTVNFWPGTGLFMAEGLKGRGVHNLVKILQGKKLWKEYETE